jgi:glycosyltransferase involved in cell wall biosynthesis
MKVLQAVTLSERGGAQRHVADLARELVRRGHEVHVATSGTGPLVDEARAAGAEVHVQPDLVRELDLRRDAAAFRGLRALVARLRPDVVHGHSSKAGFLARAAAASRRVPAVYTAHGFVFLEPLPRARRAAYLAVEAAGGRAGKRLIAVSERDAEAARRYRLAPAARIVTIPNGYDPPTAPAPFPTGGTFRFAVVANPYPTKGLPVLLDALERLAPAASFEVLVAGDGPMRAGLEARSAGLPVRWLGAVDDVPALLASAHAAVLPSLKEGWPYAVLEAMGAARAVIATDVGGVPVQLGGDEAGWVVPPGDAGALARALSAALADPAEARRRGRRGYERLRERFPLAAMADAVLGQYEEVVRGR